MAHNLNEVNGKTAMMYYGAKPWHGLGTELDAPATAAVAIEAAGLNWNVEVEPLYTKENVVLGDRFQGIVRQDTRQVLGVVSERYAPIQNADAFGFFDEVVGDGQAIYHTAGALGLGERIWILAKLPGDIRIDGTDDVTEKFLLLTTSHDGGSALKAFYTPVRVVCQNTLSAALGGAKDGISIRHTGNLMDKVAEAQRVLGLAVSYYAGLNEVYNQFAKKQVNRSIVAEYLKALIPDPKEGNKQRAENMRSEIVGLFENGMGNDRPGVRGTAWALLNGVSEYVTHNRTARVLDAAGMTKETAETTSRLNALWFGSGKTMNSRAFDLGLELVGIKK